MQFNLFLLRFFVLCLLSLTFTARARRRPSSSSKRVVNDEEEVGVDEDERGSGSGRRRGGGEGGGDRDEGDSTKSNRARSPAEYLSKPTPTSMSNAVSNRAVNGKRLTCKGILENHHLYNEGKPSRSFKGELMIYVTPWNRKGYENSILMAKKTDWLVPVWFTVQQLPNKTLILEGSHDVNDQWLQDVRAAATAPQSSNVDVSNECVDEDQDENGECLNPAAAADASVEKVLKIVPRVLVAAPVISTEDASEVFALLDECLQKYGFDGFTLEVGLERFQFIVSLTRTMKESGHLVVLVSPPIQLTSTDGQNAMALEILSVGVDRFSVMTYDHNKGQGLPNAPIRWVESVMSGMAALEKLKGKVLMGLPLYGWRGDEAMTADSMVLWLAGALSRNQRDCSVSIEWDEGAEEHLFVEEKKNRQSSYPTVLFLKRRLRVADDLGIAGAALWEAGQMMSMFIDVF